MIDIKRLSPFFLTPLALSWAFPAPETRGTEVPLADAAVFIEFNSTDGDFGIQFFWDGDPWDRMTVVDPSGKNALKVKINHGLQRQGLTEGFFESAEPPTSVLSMAQFLQRFPEGDYDFAGATLTGERLVGEAEFTHVMPAPPANLSPGEGAAVSATAPLVLSFDAVIADLNGAPLQPEYYEVILQNEDSGRTMTVELDGDVASPMVIVPPGFVSAGTEYKFEVIVEEESGNRTISEVAFTTAASSP